MNKEVYNTSYYQLDYGNPKTKDRLEKYWQVNKYDWGYTHPVFDKNGIITCLAMKYYECDISFRSCLIEISHDVLKKKFDKCLVSINPWRREYLRQQPNVSAFIRYPHGEGMVQDISEMDWYEQVAKSFSSILEVESCSGFNKNDIIYNGDTNYQGPLWKGTDTARPRFTYDRHGRRALLPWYQRYKDEQQRRLEQQQQAQQEMPDPIGWVRLPQPGLQPQQELR